MEMRDILGDLEERAAFLQREIVAAGDDYDKAVNRLQCELKARLSALSVAMLAEEYRGVLADFLDSERMR
jgi:hypothetical protein